MSLTPPKWIAAQVASVDVVKRNEEINRQDTFMANLRALVNEWEKIGGTMSYESHKRAAQELRKVIDDHMEGAVG